MTELEWLACTDPWSMLEFLQGKASDRKLRLFACACCRMLPSSKDEPFQQALEASEQYADGQTTKAALKRARQGVRAARFALPASDPQVHGERSVYWLAEVAASENAANGVGSEMQRLANQGILDLPPRIRASICTLFRDLFGNPFQPVALNKKWLKPKVVNLAHGVYEKRAFDRLPVLANALCCPPATAVLGPLVSRPCVPGRTVPGSRPAIIHRDELSSQPGAEVVLDGEGPWQLAPDFLAIPTPGHTKGHCVLLFNERFLFTGDHLDWDRDEQHLSASEDYCWYSWPQQAESMERLAAYRFEWVLPGHGQSVHLPAAEMRQQVRRLARSMRVRSGG